MKATTNNSFCSASFCELSFVVSLVLKKKYMIYSVPLYVVYKVLKVKKITLKRKMGSSEAKLEK